jgi:hypothetical protein
MVMVTVSNCKASRYRFDWRLVHSVKVTSPVTLTSAQWFAKEQVLAEANKTAVRI